MIVLDVVRQTVAAVAHGPIPTDPSASLFQEGTIDSFGVIELVAHIEDAFGIKVSDADMVPSRFETLEMIVAYVESHRS